MVDTWQIHGSMVVMVNHRYAMGQPLTHGQTVEIETSTCFCHRYIGGPVADSWLKGGYFCEGEPQTQVHMHRSRLLVNHFVWVRNFPLDKSSCVNWYKKSCPLCYITSFQKHLIEKYFIRVVSLGFFFSMLMFYSNEANVDKNWRIFWQPVCSVFI